MPNVGTAYQFLFSQVQTLYACYICEHAHVCIIGSFK